MRKLFFLILFTFSISTLIAQVDPTVIPITPENHLPTYWRLSF